jgi:hypothetical protein
MGPAAGSRLTFATANPAGCGFPAWPARQVAPWMRCSPDASTESRPADRDLQGLVADPGLRSRLAKTGREVAAREFSSSAVRQQYQALYHRLAGRA